jgi:hypothetical protein
MLQAKGACAVQAHKFRDLFPGGVVLTEALCLAHASNFNFTWGARNLLSDTAREAYEKACAPDLEAYSKACDTAWEAYCKAPPPGGPPLSAGGPHAQEAYCKACDTAQEAYSKACAPALEAYEKASAPAWEAYCKACGTAQEACSKACAIAFFAGWQADYAP